MLQSGLKKRKEPVSRQGPASQGPTVLPEASWGCWHQVDLPQWLWSGRQWLVATESALDWRSLGLLCAPLLCDSGSPSPSLGLGGEGLGGSGWMPWEQEIQWWDEMVRSLIHSRCQGNV